MGEYTPKMNYRQSTVLLQLMFCLLILNMRFPLGHILTRVWSICRCCICIQVRTIFLMNSVNFVRKVKSSTSSGREFQILGPNVLRLLSSNVLVVALLTTKSFFSTSRVWTFLEISVHESLDLRILKSYKLRLAFDGKLLQLE